LFASNIKAFGVASAILFFLFILRLIDILFVFDLLIVFSIFSLIEIFLSFPKAEIECPDIETAMDHFFAETKSNTPSLNLTYSQQMYHLNISTLLKKQDNRLPEWSKTMIAKNLKTEETDKKNADNVLIIDDVDDLESSENTSCSLIICRAPLNNVKRLNQLFERSTRTIEEGGLLLVTYRSLESELEELRRNSNGVKFCLQYLLHFIVFRAIPKSRIFARLYFSPFMSWLDRTRRESTDRQKRSIARAEALGRFIYWGMSIIAEDQIDEKSCIIAAKISTQKTDRIPSYHAIVALEKVGLGGEVIKLHKIRSMYPFSEFLQKGLYDQHGLTNTGKFKNDFRLTDYGPFIRKYWIDEIPGIYDWLKGDVKLVGMRATSPHFLSLYPREVVKLYFKVKPGLIPPIFDEKTTGFEQIVEIEKAYLQRYLENPVKTDFLYFFYTLRDIFIRKVRSK